MLVNVGITKHENHGIVFLNVSEVNQNLWHTVHDDYSSRAAKTFSQVVA